METLHPGLYSQEVSGTPPMEGVSTSTGAFVGIAPKGEIGKAVLVTSWTQYVAEFGGYIADSYLAYAVQGFFKNGGKRCYISRVVHYDGNNVTSKKSKLDIKGAPDSEDVLAIVSAKNDGVWGDSISVAITPNDVKFSLVVSYEGNVVETYDNLDLDTAEEYIKSSKYISLDIISDTPLPKVVDTKLTGGDDGVKDITPVDFVGDETKGTGLHAFDSVKINLLAVPGMTSADILKEIIAYVELRQDCFAILDTPKGQTPQEVDEYVTKTANLASEYAGVYYPWIQVNDPIGVGKNPKKFLPPSGYVMGAFAKMDTEVGVWRAPAGTDSQLLGVIDLEYSVSDNEQDILNPDCINCIRAFTGDGIIIWGARTLSKGEYKYIPVRRVMMFVRQSLLANLRWTVFRPNDSVLWNATTNTVFNFLSSFWSQGGLKGSSPKEAFFVVCDDTINTADTVDEGKMFVDIGICPRKPAEFVIFRLSLTR